jgi:transcription factor SPT20
MMRQQHEQQQARPSQVAENYAATMAAMAGRSAGVSANRSYNFLKYLVIDNIQRLNTQQMEQIQQAQAQSLARGQLTRHVGGWRRVG